MVEDIVEEILIRLPAKTLSRCRILSRDTNDFISRNPAFRKRYLRRNEGCSVMLGFFTSKKVPYTENEKVRFLPTSTQGIKRRIAPSPSSAALPSDESLSFLGYDETHVLATSNGFLLCSSPNGRLRRNYSICNPMNKERIDLPPHKIECLSATHGFVWNSTSPHINMVDYYQIVRAIPPNRYDKINLNIEIFSSDTAVWEIKHLVSPRPFNFNIAHPSTVVIEKDLIFLVGMVPTQEFYESGVLIFDQKKESLQLLLYPTQESGNGLINWFGKSDGAILFARHEPWQLKVWILNCEETANGQVWEWSLKHNVRLEVTVETHPGMVRFSDPPEPFMFVAFHPSNQNKIFLDNFRKKVLVYNLESSKLEINFSLSEQGWKLSYDLFPYMYGLIGPHLFIDD